MPATEQTWYNQKRLHVVFGVASLVLLGATIWMLVADHYRPWKVIQGTYADIETRFAQLKILEVKTAAFLVGLDELERDVAAAQRQTPDASLIKQFESRAKAMLEAGHIDNDHAKKIEAAYAEMQKLQASFSKIAESDGQYAEAAESLVEARADVFKALQTVIDLAAFNEGNLTALKKSLSSHRDAAKSNYDLAIRDDLSADVVARMLKVAKEKEAAVGDVDIKVQEIKAARVGLVAIVTELKAPAAKAQKALDDYRTDIERLHLANVERSGEGLSSYIRWIPNLPVLDIGGTTKPAQIWLPGLTINYNLKHVARFDRCITCHRGLTATEPGSAATPAFPHEAHLTFEIVPARPGDDEAESTLLSVYEMSLAPRGLLVEGAVTIVVAPKTLAARAGLKTADVLTKIGGKQVLNKKQAESLLLTSVAWGEPVEIEVRRGLPHPYSAHPRLDLFGTDSSPHPFVKIGCTVCHDGQGPATDYQHSEHTPSTTMDEDRWRKEHGWFANHFWEFPQRAKRFLESNCLKCHHTVTELEASDRFPDPPAPQLMKGYHLIRKYGCFGCHDINGYDGPEKTIGPDLRVEPDFFTWAIKLQQTIGPKAAKLRKRYQAADKLEHDLVAQYDVLSAQKTAATKAGQQSQIDRIEGRLETLAGGIAVAAKVRRSVEGPYDTLNEMLSLAGQVRDVPEESETRAALRKLLTADAQRGAVAANELALDLVPKISELRTAIAAAINEQAKLKKQLGAETDAQKIAGLNGQIKTAVDAQKTAEAALAMLDRMLKLAQTSAANQQPVDQRALDRLRAMLAEDAARGPDAQLLPADMHALGVRLKSLLSPSEHAAAERLEDVKAPGTMRKVGPSLRYASSKLDRTFLLDWLNNPTHFRPETRMPKIFGNHAHLKNEDGSETESSRLAKRLEAVEIRALAEYLLAASDPFEYVEPPSGVVPIKTDEDKQQQIDRGRDLVVTRGCLACHSIRDEGRFDPDEDVSAAIIALGKADQDQGPDLSRIGAKLVQRGDSKTRDPQRWLTSWLREPSRYHARTKMPDLFLDPIAVDKADKPARYTDPAADIAAYLLSLQGATPWHPVAVEENNEALDELSLMHLRKTFDKRWADQFAISGIPASRRASLAGAEVELVVRAEDNWDDLSETDRTSLIRQKKLRYVGRRVVSKYGCFGCHDIPGFEDAKPIGTALASWGRKGTDKLAFGQIVKYHGIKHDVGHGDTSHGDTSHGDDGHGSADSESAQREAYFHHRLMHGDRDGFLWQKLREPRSYDYKKTETSGFNEWLRMPKFNFSDEEIEAVMTFVLGLVAEPPAEKYLYRPDPRRKAIIEGQAVLAKYNCQGCHVLSPERLDLAIVPGTFATPEKFNNYEFLRSLATPLQLRNSQNQDRRGRVRFSLSGLDALSDDSPTPYLLTDPEDPSSIYEDDPDFPYDGPFFRPFVLWKNVLVDGRQHLVGQKALILSELNVLRKVPVHGGVATRLMMPLVYEQVKPIKANLTGNATRALVAPPLIGEGRKVQTAWLHDFLLDPYPIRPAVQLRMPKFNMSPQEASKLVAYFAAVDNVEYPYAFDPRTRDAYLSKMESRHPNYLGDAMKIVVGVCSECHKIGDFSPQGDPTAMAPNLDRIYQRLRPEYLRDWIANPRSTLPYTEMPVNFSHENLKFQQYYHGTSAEQIAAVVDLLLNYDQHTKSQIPVSAMVKKAKAAAGAKDNSSE